MEPLRRLTADRTRIVLPSSFRSGDDLVLDAYDDTVEDFGREVDIAEARAVLSEAMHRYDPTDPVGRTRSDGWLAPRLHATLRLTPREASDQTVWHFLAMKAFPTYVVWRWKDREDAIVPVNRYLGD